MKKNSVMEQSNTSNEATRTRLGGRGMMRKWGKHGGWVRIKEHISYCWKWRPRVRRVRDTTESQTNNHICAYERGIHTHAHAHTHTQLRTHWSKKRKQQKNTQLSFLASASRKEKGNARLGNYGADGGGWGPVVLPLFATCLLFAFASPSGCDTYTASPYSIASP